MHTLRKYVGVVACISPVDSAVRFCRENALLVVVHLFDSLSFRDMFASEEGNSMSSIQIEEKAVDSVLQRGGHNPEQQRVKQMNDLQKRVLSTESHRGIHRGNTRKITD